MPDYDDLAFTTLDPHVTEGPEHDRLVGWGEAISRGFHEGRMSDDFRRFWIDSARADRATLRGAWPQRTTVATGHLPVATFCSFDGTINVGGERTLPLHMITDVTVSPSHRRRGLLRTLMTENLAAAAAAGHALAALTVTEGTIYGRFGFGAAVERRALEVDVTARFGLHHLEDDGTLELVEPAEALATVQSLFARHLGTTRGAVSRPQFYDTMRSGAFDPDKAAPDRTLRGVVHLDASGEVDGCCLYRHSGEQDGRATLDVVDLLAVTPATTLRLWRFLADVDLVERVRWSRAATDDPLPWAVLDPRAVRTTRVSDALWVRVLDVKAALEARPWYADGTVVLGVDDALGHASGSWQVVVRDGRAQVVATDDAPVIRLGADVLGSLYLGGVDVRTLAAAGRVHGDTDGVRTLAAMADGGPAPHCTTSF